LEHANSDKFDINKYLEKNNMGSDTVKAAEEVGKVPA
jgi:hypothetical protein